MLYTYEADIWHDVEDGCWYAKVPAFGDLLTDGWTLKEAVENAADVLMLYVAEYLDEGKTLPEPVFSDPPKTVLCVDVTDEFRALSKCVTVKEAAEYLEVSPSRVSQLLSEGKLETYMHGNTRMVTIASMNERLANKPPAHRPRKEATVA